ncbi:SURF1 family protein [Cellulomonas sp. 73-145]|uniref:SURF1 family protein n=1 Tax=Cellulomonas sp. 73-145 TaxID=1895739 RepID=UPI0025C3DF6C|nr:SURF1 family protein [Cellulomonas sp. 73-145]
MSPLPSAPPGPSSDRGPGRAEQASGDASAPVTEPTGTQVPDAEGTDVPAPSGGAARWFRAAVTPRMLGMLALLLLAAAVCARLGVWQLDRAQVRGAAAEQQHQAELTTAAPVPLDQVIAPQQPFTGGMVGRKVQVSGTYDPAGQLQVTGRVVGGRHGSLVLTPLHVSTPQGAAVLAVVRGFVPDGEPLPAAPGGTVSVIGYLQAGEAPGAGVSDGRTEAISPAELVGVWGGPTWTGYVVLASSDPAQGDPPTVLPPPTRRGTGLNLQNLSYAAQWWIFAGFALLLWWRMVRDEARGNPFEDGNPFEGEASDVPGATGGQGGRPS